MRMIQTAIGEKQTPQCSRRHTALFDLTKSGVNHAFVPQKVRVATVYHPYPPSLSRCGEMESKYIISAHDGDFSSFGVDVDDLSTTNSTRFVHQQY